MADKKTEEWDAGYKTAISQVLDIIKRANISTALKTKLRKRVKKLQIEIGMTEKKLSLEEL